MIFTFILTLAPPYWVGNSMELLVVRSNWEKMKVSAGHEQFHHLFISGYACRVLGRRSVAHYIQLFATLLSRTNRSTTSLCCTVLRTESTNRAFIIKGEVMWLPPCVSQINKKHRLIKPVSWASILQSVFRLCRCKWVRRVLVEFAFKEGKLNTL